jgi:hypothetical protein
MSRLRERPHRGSHYRQLADGYRALKSPLAEAFSAAAEHYQKSELPAESADKRVERFARDASEQN